MSKLQLSFASGLYDRMQALYTGEVKPDGIDLNFIPIDQPRPIFDRMSGGQEFDVSEYSLSEFTQRFTRNECPFVAIPVFPSIAFRMGFIAINKKSGIKTPKDLEGKTLGGAVGDGALKLFPAFCKITKIDCDSIKITNMAPNLREQMLMQKQVDGVFGYVNTIRFSAMLIHVDPDKDIRFINYGDYGMDLYSNAIIVSKKLVKDNPAAVKGLIGAINHGLLDTLKDPDAAVAAVAKREPLINVKVERERLDATLKDEMNSPEIAKIGLGNVDAARLKRSIDILVNAEGLPRTPAIDEVWTSAFLPPVDDLPKKLF